MLMGNRWLPLEIRFWMCVQKMDDPESCWLWIGAKTGAGYGALGLNYKFILAHRYSYELHFGAIPTGLRVCHHCDTPACVNPSHLFIGTARDNTQDMMSKGRKPLGKATAPKNPASGERHGCAVLTWKQVEKIRKLYAEGHSATKLAKQFRTSITNLCDIVHFKLWRNEDSPPPIRPGTKKLTQEQADQIRAGHEAGVSGKDLSKQYGVCPATISMIINNRRWTSD
jgi:Mor family transcriptional regulator